VKLRTIVDVSLYKFQDLMTTAAELGQYFVQTHTFQNFQRFNESPSRPTRKKNSKFCN